MNEDPEDRHRVWNARRKNGQFVPGTSGNPKGRPRKSHSTQAIFQAMLRSKVSVKIGEEIVNLTVVEAMAERVKREALKGSLRGLEKGVEMAQKYSAPDPVTDEESEADLTMLSDEELDLLGRLTAKMQGVDWDEYNANLGPLSGTEESSDD